MVLIESVLFHRGLNNSGDKDQHSLSLLLHFVKKKVSHAFMFYKVTMKLHILNRRILHLKKMGITEEYCFCISCSWPLWSINKRYISQRLLLWTKRIMRKVEPMSVYFMFCFYGEADKIEREHIFAYCVAIWSSYQVHWQDKICCGNRILFTSKRW